MLGFMQALGVERAAGGAELVHSHDGEVHQLCQSKEVRITGHKVLSVLGIYRWFSHHDTIGNFT